MECYACSKLAVLTNAFGPDLDFVRLKAGGKTKEGTGGS